MLRKSLGVPPVVLFSLLQWLRRHSPRIVQRLQGLLLRVLGIVSGSGTLNLAGGAAYARAVGLSAPTTKFRVSAMDTCTVADGLVLRGSLLLPRGEGGPYPTVIIRTPYGHKADFGQRLLAERGFAVLVQDTRGRFSSDGTFVPVQHEREDGAATLAWVQRQPWCNGRVGVFGVSYLGFTAWAAVGMAGEQIDAAVVIVSQASVRSAVFHRDGAISFELAVLWLYLVLRLLSDIESDPASFTRKLFSGLWKGTLGKAVMHVPIRDVDSIILGEPMEFFQEALRSYDDPTSTFWEDKDVLNDFSGVSPPTHMLTGWYDIFREQCLEDFNRAGGRARITIGPFSHWESITWEGLYSKILVETFQEHLCDRPRSQGQGDARIRAAVLGTESYISFHEWPPPSDPTVLFLGAEGHLRRDPQAPWDQAYRYDPATPTPSVGGPSFNFFNAGARDQAQIEARDDVVVFTSPPLESNLLVAGTAKLDLVVRVGSKSADFVGRLCDVSPAGVSVNRCEGLTRVLGRDGETQRVVVDFGSTCSLFRRGHCVRLQVCSGAHPRWFRNLQTGEDVATGSRMVSAWHRICSGSTLTLPTLPTGSRL